jgi:hypothetical protein
MSKTMIRAVKAEASSTGALGEHNTLPTSRWMGSIAVRYSVTFDPAAAHCTLSDSVSIAASAVRALRSKEEISETDLSLSQSRPLAGHAGVRRLASGHHRLFPIHR